MPPPDAIVSEREKTHDILIHKAINYLLLREPFRQPIKLADLNKHLSEHHSVGRSDFREVFHYVKRKLYDVFGLRLVTVKGGVVVNSLYPLSEVLLDDEASVIEPVLSKASTVLMQPTSNCEMEADVGEGDGDDLNGANDLLDLIESSNRLASGREEYNSSMFTNKLLLDNHVYDHDDFVESCNRGLIMIVLSFILLNGFPVSETELFAFLESLGFDLDAKIDHSHGKT